MTQEKTVFQSPGGWVEVIETPRKFYYLRRKGKNSVAVFLIRKHVFCFDGEATQEEWQVLTRLQPLPIHNADLDEEMKLFPCPITGGLEDENEDLKEAALRECLEESGYRLPTLHELGSYIVGTQTDETVFMFYADVTGIQPESATQDGTYFESISKNEWRSLVELNDDGYAANQIGYFRLERILPDF